MKGIERAEIITGNYHRKLSQEIITGNYQLVCIYHHANNVGIIGILAYPKKLFLKSYQVKKS